MPKISLYNVTEKKNVWLTISDVHIDKDGYLQFFTVDWNQGTQHYHYVKHDALFWATLGAAIFNAATSLRSAKGLLQDFNKVAGKEGWHGRAGNVGMTFGSAALLILWLKSRPYQKEGYHDSNGEFWIDEIINTKDPLQYQK